MNFKCWLNLDEKVNIPKLNRIGSELSTTARLIRGPHAWNQSDNNCLDIADLVAKKFGFQVPSKGMVMGYIWSLKEYLANLEKFKKNLINKSPQKPLMPTRSIANLVVRTTPDSDRVHVAFEFYGKEFNYGAASDSGYNITFRIPCTHTN